MGTFKELERRAARNASLVWWVALTFLGAAINMAGLALANYRFPVQEYRYMGSPTVNPQNLLIVAFLGFLIPLSYSYLASHSLPTKRYVGPAEIAVISIAVVLLRTDWGISNQFFVSIYLVMVGLVDEALAKSIVGVGGSDTNHRTWKVTASIKDLTKFINQEDVRGVLSLSEMRSRHSDNLVIFRRSYTNYRRYVVLAADSSDKTFLHCEGYWIGRYVIGIDKTSERLFEKDMGYLEDILRDEGKFQLEAASFDGNFPFFSEARRIILEPTESKFAALSRLPRQTIAVIVGISFLALAMYLSYPPTNQVTQQALASALIGLGSLFVGLVPFIRGPVSRKEWE